ncbi:MAG: DUF1036 domain-containing protein [Rhizobiales bacterium]|nr:DUF1036 domain-containing protein [Hyphomicrobiales bacterium]
MKNAQIATCAAALILSSLLLIPASAEFTVCNQTQSRVGVAIGYQGEKDWTTEGWWNLKPGGCETVLPGQLDGRYYYVLARDWDKGGDWGGATPMCTQTKVFTIDGIKDCKERGFDTSGFYEIDTGTQSNWKVQLTEGGVQ